MNSRTRKRINKMWSGKSFKKHGVRFRYLKNKILIGEFHECDLD